ncbi:MAG: M50 family metallopeptidase [Cyanobacteria bacterium HKST-UBA02]|nr:M50 family metallopeptidase [Cyanobacteria bacterium HKST-UBA02]
MKKGEKKKTAEGKLRFRVEKEGTGLDRSTEAKLARLEAEMAAQEKPLVPTDNSTGEIKETGRANLFLLGAVFLFTLFIAKLPFSDFIFGPLNQFATMIHEMSHAIACVATGGHVTSMTIVPDGQGHGGLTSCIGGIRFIHYQAGYLGTAIAGCLLIFFGQFKHRSRETLVAVGTLMLLSTIFFMIPGLLSPMFFQALASLIWGVVLSLATIYAGLKLKDSMANLLLLFLAINTAMDSLRSITMVMTASIFARHIFSDATNMEQLFGMPAILWSLLWLAISLAMLGFTIWLSYFRKR